MRKRIPQFAPLLRSHRSCFQLALLQKRKWAVRYGNPEADFSGAAQKIVKVIYSVNANWFRHVVTNIGAVAIHPAQNGKYSANYGMTTIPFS